MSYFGDYRDEYEKGREDEHYYRHDYDHDRYSHRESDEAYFRGRRDEHREEERRREDREEEEHQERLHQERMAEQRRQEEYEWECSMQSQQPEPELSQEIECGDINVEEKR
jgi:hypothetical protein